MCKANQLHFLMACPRILLYFTRLALGKLLSEILQAEKLLELWKKLMTEAEGRAHLNQWNPLKAQISVSPWDNKQGKCGSNLPGTGLFKILGKTSPNCRVRGLCPREGWKRSPEILCCSTATITPVEYRQETEGIWERQRKSCILTNAGSKLHVPWKQQHP